VNSCLSEATGMVIVLLFGIGKSAGLKPVKMLDTDIFPKINSLPNQ